AEAMALLYARQQPGRSVGSTAGFASWDGCELFYAQVGEGVPLLLIHPAGATGSTWGAAVEELARIGRVVTYDRRGYARSGGEPVRSVSAHAADAAALLENPRSSPAVVVGASAGAAIAVDLAVRPASLAVRNSRTRFKHRTWFGTQTRDRHSTARTRFASFELSRDSSRISRPAPGSALPTAST